MDHIPERIGDQFSLLFDSNDNFTLLKKEALSGRLKQYSHFHFLVWQVLLDLLPTEGNDTSGIEVDKWKKACLKWRNDYKTLKDEMMVNPYASASEIDDATHDNPLSTGESSTWAKYFENNELRQDIQRDVSRTYPEIDFFREPAIQDLLTTVLFIYAKKHPEISYKQGMHEILAPLIYILHKERIENYNLISEVYSPAEGKPDRKDLLIMFNDPSYMENDSYALFSKILEFLGPFYQQSSRQRPTTPQPIDKLDNSLGISITPGNGNDDSSQSTVVRKCKLIQDVLLKKHDEQLSVHLNEIGLEPQLFLLRWLRILFGREFHLEDTLTVWDAIFAFDSNFGLIDYMAVSMLIFIRSQLIGKDFADCIKRLQKYPPVEDVSILIEHAIALTKPRPAGNVGPLPFGRGASYPPSLLSPVSTSVNPANSYSVLSNPTANIVSVATKPAPTATATPKKPIVYASPTYNAQSQQQSSGINSIIKKAKWVSNTGNSSPSNLGTQLSTPPKSSTQKVSSDSSSNSGMVSIPKAEFEEMKLKLENYQANQDKFATKLEKVITTLQSQLSLNDLPNGLADLLVLTIAGLKKTRDVAYGFIDDADGDDDFNAIIAGIAATICKPQSSSSTEVQQPTSQQSQPPVTNNYSTRSEVPVSSTRSPVIAVQPIEIPASSDESKAAVDSIFDSL